MTGGPRVPPCTAGQWTAGPTRPPEVRARSPSGRYEEGLLEGGVYTRGRGEGTKGSVRRTS
ncbi:uncharacterized protein SCHCODRAFT_01326569 [Schizophyllum commune H4-8]|uniref:uncharacterized protein n=1 Tax=Schizophyllum commune (strain H4-8 / FGSC 9210) TaxID=578458 RepID=UPI00215FD17A|nr:uncharacterized protein SCHCODRAFT_01326569 [Schizophyllum commune H4-8]KAI5889578.1 hypothetical protein SCHCODRAFT_01326569 [Schizophyllum commune H4-8]